MNRTLITATLVFVFLSLAFRLGVCQTHGPTANPKVRIIVVKEEATGQKVLEELKGGASFSSLARKYSVGPNAEQGGYIGTISSSELEGDLRDAVTGLEVGEASRLIKTKLGYTIVQITTDEFFKAGVDYYRMGKYKNAIKNLNQDVKINPDSALSFLYLGMAHAASGNLERAIASYRRSTDINPNLAETHYNLANALKRSGDPDQAASMYQKALEISPDLAAAHNNLAWLYAEQGVNLDEGLNHAMEANKKSPNNPIYIETLAQLYFKKGDVERAIEEMNRAIRLDFNNAYYREQLAVMRGEAQPVQAAAEAEEPVSPKEASPAMEAAQKEAAPTPEKAPEPTPEKPQAEEPKPSAPPSSADALKIQILSATGDKSAALALSEWLQENNYPVESVGAVEVVGWKKTTLFYQEGYKEKTLEIAHKMKGEQDVARQKSPSPYNIIIIVGGK